MSSNANKSLNTVREDRVQSHLAEIGYDLPQGIALEMRSN